jgi:hypothetical protein
LFLLLLFVCYAAAAAVQVWEKLTNYFEVEPRWVDNRPGHYMASTEDLIAACDENTIGQCAWTMCRHTSSVKCYAVQDSCSAMMCAVNGNPTTTHPLLHTYS